MFVYVIENTANGKRYVGKSDRPAKRWAQHKINARNGIDSVLYRAMRKYGEDSFEFSVVEECGPEAASFERVSEAWIAALGTHGERGYNATPGGEGIVVTPELRAKWSEQRKGKSQPKQVAAMKSALARKREATLEKVRQGFDPSLTHKQLAEKLGVSQGTVQSALKQLGLRTTGAQDHAAAAVKRSGQNHWTKRNRFLRVVGNE